jgi:hypothetical protein
MWPAPESLFGRLYANQFWFDCEVGSKFVKFRGWLRNRFGLREISSSENGRRVRPSTVGAFVRATCS